MCLLSAAMVIACPLWASGLGSGLPPQFAQSAQSLLTTEQTPGMAFCVADRDRTIAAIGIGECRIGTKAPVTELSLFHWASVTKAFVGTAVTTLADEGRVDLDAPVITYLPYFCMADDRCQSITLHHILRHRSGMPDVVNYGWHKPEFDEGALERYVRSLSDESLLFAPGSESKYSNMAFEVAGDVIAKAAGEPFEDFMADRLFRPVGMKHTTLLKAEADESLLVAPHTALPSRGAVIRPHWPYNRAHGPSSTLISNAEDMARWIRMCLNRGAIDGTQVLPAGIFDTMWTVQHGEDGGEGLGWFIGDVRGNRAVYHHGGDQGFRSALYLFPDEGIGFALVMNSDKAPREGMLELAFDTVLEPAGSI